MQRENRSKTVKRSQNFKRVVADKMFIFLYSNTIHKGNTWWEISVTTLMAQYMCWPLSTSCRKRYETKIDTKMSVSPLERMGQEKCHKHTCFQWWLHYVSKYVFFLYITYSNTYFLYMFIYMLKGSITDGHGFEPQRFTGLQTLAQRNCPRSSPPLTPSQTTPPPPSTEGRWWLLRCEDGDGDDQQIRQEKGDPPISGSSTFLHNKTLGQTPFHWEQLTSQSDQVNYWWQISIFFDTSSVILGVSASLTRGISLSLVWFLLTWLLNCLDLADNVFPVDNLDIVQLHSSYSFFYVKEKAFA